MQHEENPNVRAAGESPKWQVLDSESAFREVYAIFWKRLYAVAFSRLKDRQEAEDVVHDVFVSLWTNRNKVKIRLIENYLFVAVKNRVLTQIRKRISERAYLQSVTGELSVNPQLEASLQGKWILEKLQNEMELLPDKCKQIFKYSRNDGLQVKQIAERLEISPKTVENQLNKALKRLRFAVSTLLNTL